jgi:hypothetical protein
MLAYEASDKIAAHIADQVKGHTLYIYDSQTFANILAYETYSATVSSFEVNFRLFLKVKPKSAFQTSAEGAQAVAATLAALRSTAEYAADTVNVQTDPVIAQLAHHLEPGTVVVPKFLFVSADDLLAPDTTTLQEDKTGCADIKRTIPDQIGCLQLARTDAAAAASSDKNSQAAFADLDKLYQVFFGTLLGTSLNVSSSSSTQAHAADQGSDNESQPGASQGGGSQSGANPSANQPPAASPLAQLIQGHRLKAQFTADPASRVLVLEVTEAGGGSRVKHMFFTELFWGTPTPTFTGGSIVTYLLINPTTSRVEKAEVLRFTVDYGKFHGKKIEAPSNF